MVSEMEFKQPEKLKYPKSVAFIISKEFCERFNYYGMRTVLVLYLTRNLGYNDDEATVLYHVFTSLAYLFPIFGAIIADSWLGRFKTILYLSIVYAIGSVLIAIGAIPILHLPANSITIIGLILIAIGTGGIKPCVSAFGGDQFQIPEQAKALATFFSLFYMAINAGSLISTTLTPILREDVHCFGEKECFSLAFGVPGLLMIIAICIFVCGKPFYQIRKTSGNMLVLVSKCIGNAIKSRCQENLNKSHWLEYAEPIYGKRLVNDIKMLLKILLIFIPVPIFWALLDQQGSRWTFQATRMMGEVGGITIKPDQIQVLNPLLIVGLIPLFNWMIYPLMEKIHIRTPLQKMTVGMLFAACSFCISGLLELKLENIQSNHHLSQFRIINALNCSYRIVGDISDNVTLEPGKIWNIQQSNHAQNSEYRIQSIGNSSDCHLFTDTTTISIANATEDSSFIVLTTTDGDIGQIQRYSDLFPASNNNNGNDALIRILTRTRSSHEIELKKINFDYSIFLFTNSSEYIFIPAGNYEVLLQNKSIKTVNFESNGVYAIVVVENKKHDYIVENHAIQKPNSINMLWQIPQYVVITIAEIMVSVTGLEFSFTQAPESMKSVLQACWLLNVSLGNVIVIIVTEVKFFTSQAMEFFFFALLMLIDMVLFILLSIRYQYKDPTECIADDDNHVILKNSSKKINNFTDAVVTTMVRDNRRAGMDNRGFTSEL